MYRSLFSELKKLVYNGESGILQIKYEYGGRSKIYLKEGLVEGVEAEGVTGADAVRICARWLSISTHFSKKAFTLTEKVKRIDTNAFLSALESVDNRIQKINAAIPGNDTIFKIDIDKLDNQSQLAPKTLKIILLVDGQRTVKDIVQASDLLEIDVLSTIYKLKTMGVAEVLTTQKPIEKEKRESFLGALKDILIDLVGPMAEMLIIEAFDALKIRPELISKSQLPQLVASIGTNLDQTQKLSLEKWGQAYF